MKEAKLQNWRSTFETSTLYYVCPLWLNQAKFSIYVLWLLFFWLKPLFQLGLKNEKTFSIGLGISTSKKHRLTMHDSKQYHETCWKEKKASSEVLESTRKGEIDSL